MAKTSTSTIAPSTATLSPSARNSAPGRKNSTTSRRSTASATATRSSDCQEQPLPDGAMFSGLTRATGPATRFRQRWVSPLLRRILLVNALPLALLVVALLYLDQYQNGLLEAQVTALREQARVFAGALGESAVRTTDPDNPKLVSEVAVPLLHRLTEPTPDAQARLYAPDGAVLADSRRREGPNGIVTTEPLPPPLEHSPALATIGWLYDHVLGLLPHTAPTPLVDTTPSAGGPDW